jgi:BolA protein
MMDRHSKETLAKGPVATEIESRLRLSLNPSHLLVINDSEKHRGHAGHDAQGGESHFTVELVSTAFIGANRVKRQRLVNDALRELLVEKIHALSIRALAPGE